MQEVLEVQQDTLLTVKEVAVRLRLSKSAVYNLIWKGVLPYVNLSCANRRVPRVRMSDVEEFIWERTRRGSSKGPQ